MQWIISFLWVASFGFAIMPSSLDRDLIALFHERYKIANRVSGRRLSFQEPGNVTDTAPAFLELAPSSMTATPLPSDDPRGTVVKRTYNVMLAQEGPPKLISPGTLGNTSLTFAVPVSPNKKIFTCICLFNTSVPRPILEIISDLWLSLKRVSPCLSIMPQSKC